MKMTEPQHSEDIKAKINEENQNDPIPSAEIQADQARLIFEKLYKTYKSCEGYTVLSIVIALTSFAVIFVIAADECRICFNKSSDAGRPQPPCPSPGPKTYWIYGKHADGGHLRHVVAILERLGYRNDAAAADWDLLWAHDYPFRALYARLATLKPHQKVNHFPGCGYITNKVDLATSGLQYIPPAFKLPDDKHKLLEHAQRHPNVTFVQKNNDHRNIRVRPLADINLDENGTFIQEFMDKPLLINGHKFDIGIYTIITSVDPLRIYIYNGDALLRFCPAKYHPFDEADLDKYVIGDDYLPIWQVPALDYYYNQLGFGMRESLNAFLEEKGENSAKIWKQVEDAIRVLVLAKEPKIVEIIKKFKSKRNFFEMMRFDFVVDEELRVYLLEANMSPNLSSAHYPPNQLLYEQVLYNMMGMLGLGERVRKDSLAPRSKAEEDMVVGEKNLATFPKECSSALCKASCVSPDCQLCKPCLSADTRQNLIEAYKEHLNRGDCKRIFPPTIDPNGKNLEKLEEYSPENQLQYRWFQGKCKLDKSWC